MLGKHAIVIGGSMAGLMAARVLSERLERVTILAKDRFPATVENRKGAPQGRLVHGLLAAGADVAYPEAEGKRPAGASFVNRYVARLHAAASYGEVVCRAFFDVINLLAPPSALFHPRVALRVLRSGGLLHLLTLAPDDLSFDDLAADAPMWHAELVARDE